MICGAVEAISPARSWSGEEHSGEGAVFLVLEREGSGEDLEGWMKNSREIFGDWGALGELLRRLT